VKTGERLDTLGQPEGEQTTVAFTPDGNSIVAGGADRQLRLWNFVSRQRAEINPLKFELGSFIDSIKNNSEPKVTLEDGMEALRVAEMIVNQIEKTQKLEI